MKALVCDCSVSAAWCLEDETSAAADEVLALAAGAEILVPPIWAAEMANVFWAAERRGRISAVDADAALAALGRLPIRVDTGTPDSAHRLLLVARARNLSAYDASYLELALRQGVPLATLDRRLSEAAHAAGVELVMSQSRQSDREN